MFYIIFFLIGILAGGVQLGPLGTAATNLPTVPAPGDCDDGEIGRMIGRGKQSTRRKLAPVPVCPPQTPAAAVGSRRLTAWATARPMFYIPSLSLLDLNQNSWSPVRDLKARPPAPWDHTSLPWYKGLTAFQVSISLIWSIKVITASGLAFIVAHPWQNTCRIPDLNHYSHLPVFLLNLSAS
jgi:hypothetical protein